MESKRFISLNAFRGFTIAAMILVNYPGNCNHAFEPLKHKAWNGITPTDLIFPFFLFIVDVSIALAYTKRLKTVVLKGSMNKKYIIITLKFFGAGIFFALMIKFNFMELRISVVLQ